IQSNLDWEYAGVYSDIGISGANTKKRDEFNRLIGDCEQGKIDIILTKSISRFARNTVDLLEKVRYLKTLGVEVRFEKENINSLSSDGELMLSILASFAQEEVFSISENVKWSLRNKFKDGTIGGKNSKVFGYRWNGEQFVIEPTEALAVKEIFRQYIDGVQVTEICRYLNDNGIKTVLGNEFIPCSLKCIITNEIYFGDRLMQKYYIDNPITKKAIKNNGELPQYLLKDCHEAILERELFEKVQVEMKRRNDLALRPYAFSGKIRCESCETNYKRAITRNQSVKWVCKSKHKKDRSCKSLNLKDEILERISSEILDLKEFNRAVFDEKIERVTVLKNNDLRFEFYGGEVKLWQEK
ncbi:MAG: recombinase family protein, partial [Coprobacillaceae bacterium]